MTTSSEIGPVGISPPVAFGDQASRDGGAMRTVRVIGVELRFSTGFHKEELALLPANVIIPNSRAYPGAGFSMPITIHTTVGDFNGEIYL